MQKNNSIPQTGKRAAIYIRTSTEQQADKISPEAQEADCRALCEARGYKVVSVYADTEKYRVKGRLVEPSSKRSDRPAYNRLLTDYDTGSFDTLVAWRQDRLYRGVTTAVIALKDRVKKGLGVEMVSGGFDVHTMEVMAWATGVELEAKHERLMMGVAGRFQQGKAWNQDPPFGYARSGDGFWVIDEVDAAWLRKIFKWYASGESVRKIRQRLIDGSAQQRETRKHVWHPRVIYKYFLNDYLWTGLYTYHWDGKDYEIAVPAIIDADTGQRVVIRRALFEKYPDGNAKHKCLCAGLVYCAQCGVRMTAINKTNSIKRKDGSSYRYEYYRCGTLPIRYEGCAKEVPSARVDKAVWEKLWQYISQPEAFEQDLQKHLATLDAQEIDAKAECAHLVNTLTELVLERQKVVSAFRKSLLTEEDLAGQLEVLSGQEKELRRELAEKQPLIGDRAERLTQLAVAFRAQVAAGIDEINTEPATEEARKRQLEFRRKIVQAVVERVDVHADKSISLLLQIELTAPVPINEHITNYVIADTHYFSFRLTL